jgi:hypothetical protein
MTAAEFAVTGYLQSFRAQRGQGRAARQHGDLPPSPVQAICEPGANRARPNYRY